MAHILSISGLRATIDELTQELVVNYANAFHEYLPAGRIIIGRDGRPSGVLIEKILKNIFRALGRDVTILGIVPTPTVQISVETSDAIGGIVITASHNPAEWNGMKFLNSDGIFLDSEENHAFWKFLDKHLDNTIVEQIGNVEYDNDAIDFHIDKILSMPFVKEILPAIQDKHFKVVVDAVNASGSFAITKLLNKLGCDVVELYCNGNGDFPHLPEPTPANLFELADAVKTYNADIGLGVDPDADRLVLIDENGVPVSEEKTICLAIDSVLRLKNIHKSCNIVVNQSTTKTVDSIADKYGAKVFRSAVGEINVVKKMKEVEAIIGGEGSGGVILPECHYGRDSLVGTFLVLGLLAHNDESLSHIIDSYTNYEMVKIKKSFSGDFNNIIKKLSTSYSTDENISTIDGIRIDFSNSWVHIRSSNTEPIIRVIAEAETKENADNLISEIIDSLEL